LAGLDYEYNSLVSFVAARVEPITLGELYSQLLSFETRLDLQNGINSAPGGFLHLLQILQPVNEVVSPVVEAAVVAPKEEAKAEVIHQTSKRIGFHHADCVGGPITLFSSAISALIQPTWEMRNQQTPHTLMVWIQTDMPTPVQQIISQGT
jgi:hypothetical protein